MLVAIHTQNKYIHIISIPIETDEKIIEAYVMLVVLC